MIFLLFLCYFNFWIFILVKKFSLRNVLRYRSKIWYAYGAILDLFWEKFIISRRLWRAGWMFFSILKFWKICVIGCMIFLRRVGMRFRAQIWYTYELSWICFGENSQFFWTLLNSWVNFFLNIKILKNLFHWIYDFFASSGNEISS